MNHEQNPLLSITEVTKKFFGTVALQDVSLALWRGEVHMLMGENGAGKSTLMKILCGALKPDSGTFHLNGEKVEIKNVDDARNVGVAVIFQEYSLVPYLNVAQNIYLGREPIRGKSGLIDHKKMHRDAREVLRRLDFDVDTHSLVEGLGVAQQQLIEIAKALSQNARILVLDEPTAALSERESQRLFKIIRDLKHEGVAMAYISHRMEEVFELGDRVSVLRDGRLITTMPARDATPDELLTLMIGRKVDMSYTRAALPELGSKVLEVTNLAAENGIHHCTLHVRRGEIVGIAGLVGSGRTELLQAIFGVSRIKEGRVVVDGKIFNGTPTDARKNRLALIPESRKEDGLALGRSVIANLLVASLPRLFPRHWYDPQRAQRFALNTMERLKIAAPSPYIHARALSGGNQQKIVIGKWLLDDAELFLFDEPTRGIDVGAKEQIFEMIDGLIQKGKSVLMVSSELVEIIRVCDRTYVMKDKTIVGELEKKDMTESQILKLAVHND